jgi:hypothetical protein
MPTKRKKPTREDVTPPLVVNKKTGVSEQIRAHVIVDTLLPQLAPVIPRVVPTPEDARFVWGWYHYGLDARKRALKRQTLFLELTGLSPLGQVCVLALALGVLGYPMPQGVPSISPPSQNAA